MCPGRRLDGLRWGARKRRDPPSRKAHHGEHNRERVLCPAVKFAAKEALPLLRLPLLREVRRNTQDAEGRARHGVEQVAAAPADPAEPDWSGLTAREGIALVRALKRLNIVFVDTGTVSPP